MQFIFFHLMWSRIFFSRLTLLYFIFSVSHFIIQFALQIKAFTVNAEAHHIISEIVYGAGTVNNSVPFLKGSNLHLCSWIPSNLKTDVASCPVVWNSNLELDSITNSMNSDANRSTSSSQSAPLDVPQTTTIPTSTVGAMITTSTQHQPVPKFTNKTNSLDDAYDVYALNHGRRVFRRDIQVNSSEPENRFPVTVTGLKGQGPIELDQSCLLALNWPRVVLRNTEREDSVFIAFQFWVLAVSIVALLNESIPHVMASLLTHVMAAGWGAFQITHTANFRSDFNRIITKGACKHNVLHPDYWANRYRAEILSLSFNGVALMLSCALTLKLVRLFGWQTFKRVGASRTINKVYKLVLSLSITIQLSLFFMVATVSLWIDQLMNSGIGDLVTFVKLYKAMSFVTLVLLIPWLMSGWFAVRRDLQLLMFIFLFLSILYLAGWGLMFFSTTFRWTFMTWTFFSVMASSSVFLTCMALLLGIFCHLSFGAGLARYLNAEPAFLEDETQFDRKGDVEEVSFPTSEKKKALPTFISFEKHAGGKLDQLLQTNFDSAEAKTHIVTFPKVAMKRNSKEIGVYRNYSNSSSTPSQRYYHSRDGSNHSSHSSRSHKERWVIE